MDRTKMIGKHSEIRYFQINLVNCHHVLIGRITRLGPVVLSAQQGFSIIGAGRFLDHNSRGRNRQIKNHEKTYPGFVFVK
jgi:hypothetical protein